MLAWLLSKRVRPLRRLKIDNLGVKHAMTEISAIKVVVPNMLQNVVDMALQIGGGAGMCSDLTGAIAAGARAFG